MLGKRTRSGIANSHVWISLLALCVTFTGRSAEPLEVIPVTGQPLAANVTRLLKALEFLGTPLPQTSVAALEPLLAASDAARIQSVLDPHVLFVVNINPESRVKVQRGPATAVLQQGGYSAALVKVINQSTVTSELHITSPQAGQVYAGMSRLSAERMQRQLLKETEAKEGDEGRF